MTVRVAPTDGRQPVTGAVPAPAQWGVVLQLTEAAPDVFAARLRNVANLRADLGPDPLIELVVHGPAVALLRTGSELLAPLAELDQVQVCACGNSLRSLAVGPQDLPAMVQVVPAGVGWLARRQQQGWAYLRL